MNENPGCTPAAPPPLHQSSSHSPCSSCHVSVRKPGMLQGVIQSSLCISSRVLRPSKCWAFFCALIVLDFRGQYSNLGWRLGIGKVTATLWSHTKAGNLLLRVVMLVLCTFPNFYLPQNVFVAVGRGLYVYNLQMKRVIACQKTAHDSSVLHVARLPNRYELPSAW